MLRDAGLTSDEAADQPANTAAVLDARYRAPRNSNPKTIDALNRAVKA